MAVTILEIAPSLAEPGKRLIDAGELYQVLQAIVDGTIPVAGVVPPASGVAVQTFVAMTAGSTDAMPTDWTGIVADTPYNISGSNIPAGATATWVAGSQSITLSFTPTATASVLVSFSPA